MSGPKYLVYSHLDTQSNRVTLRADGGNEELVCPGKLHIGSNSNPSAALDITGNVGITSDTSISGDLNNSTSTLFVDSANNEVGIGRNNPSETLYIAGTMEISGNTDIGGKMTTSALDIANANATIGGSVTLTGNLAVDSDTLFVNSTSVGIGTTIPSDGILDVRGYITEGSIFSQKQPISGSTSLHNTVNTANVSIAGEYGVRAMSVGFLMDSDSRIKKDIQDISDGTALNLIRQLQPKTYKYKNTNVSESVYGFLAQDVKSVLPHSVFITSDFIPDVFRTATVTNGNTLTLTAHGLTEGASISLKNPDKIVRIISVPNADTFTISESLNVEQVTVYGTFVQDYHTLNKDAIWTVSTAALQEVDRQLEAEKTKAAALETNIAAIETEIAAIKTHLNL